MTTIFRPDDVNPDTLTTAMVRALLDEAVAADDLATVNDCHRVLNSDRESLGGVEARIAVCKVINAARAAQGSS